MNTSLKFTKIRKVKSPCRAHSTDAGIDFFVPEDIDFLTFKEKCEIVDSYPDFVLDNDNNIVSVTLKAGESVLIPSGIKVNIPDGYAMIYNNKSGVASKRHLVVGASVVDQNYEGECHINLHNVGNMPVTISAGDKIVQGIVFPINYCNVEEVDTVENLYKDHNSDRGEGGFGSTGTK